MDNLIELIGNQLTPDVVNVLGSLSGTTPAQTQNALEAAVPSLVGALAQRGGTPAGAERILDLVGKQTGGGDILGNLVGMLGNSTSSENLLSQGAGILGSLLGGNTSKVIDAIASIAGIKGESATSLLRSLAPLALALVGKQVTSRNLNASGLADLLGGQMDFVKTAVPKGLTDVLDFAAVSPEPEKFNLIELIGKQLTPDVVDALGSLGGTTPAQTQNALGAIVPSLVGALAKRSATSAGAEGILDLVGKQTGSDDMLGNLAGLLGNSASSESLLSQGAGILGSLLGGNTSKVIDVIASIAGIKGGSATSLLKSLAPLALALLGKQVSSRKLNAAGLADLLGGQMDLVKSVAPKGLTDVLDFAPVEVSAATPPVPRVTPPAPQAPRVTPPEPPAPKRSMNWLWWLLGALALLAILWFLFLRPKPEAAVPVATPAPAAAQPAAAEGIYIPVISKGFQHQFWQAVKQGAESAAKDLNVQITFEGPESESQVDKQLEMVEAALAKNPKCLALAALDSKALVPQLVKAKDANIPVVGFDSGVDSDIPVATASTDNLAAAGYAADKMAELIGGAGKVAVIVHDQTSATGIGRRDGFVNRIKEKYPNIEIVDVQYGGGDHAKSTDLAKAIIQANPDLKGFFGANEGSAVGVVNAVKELNMAGKLVVIGYDAGKIQKDAVRSGLMNGAITQDPVGIGYKAVEACVKAIKGEAVEKNIDTGFKWWDKTNVDAEEMKMLLYD